MNQDSYFKALNLKKTWNVAEGNSKEINFSLQTEKGSMTALVGPSGSGKSTVLKMIAGLLQPNDVKNCVLVLDGINILQLPPGKRQIGMVFQSPALFPHLRTDDNVAYGLQCRGMSKKESRILAAEFLENFGMKDFGKRKVETLSGGEAQRVSLARTLIIKPKLILFDEPLSALDAPLRKKMAADIVSMQKKLGFTGIFVTHDLEEAKFVAQRIVSL